MNLDKRELDRWITREDDQAPEFEECPVCGGILVIDDSMSGEGIVYCEANSDHYRSDTYQENK